MKIFCVLSIAFLLHSSASAEMFVYGKVTFKNDSVLFGLVTFPNDPPDLPTRFKESKRAKSYTIPFTELKSIVYYYGTPQAVEYDIVYTYLGRGREKHQAKWLKLEAKGEVNLYSYIGGDSYTDMYGTLTKWETSWLFLRAGEETANVITSTRTKNKKDIFNHMALEYFKDDIGLIAKIESGEYKWSDMVKIANEYNQWKKSGQ